MKQSFSLCSSVRSLPSSIIILAAISVRISRQYFSSNLLLFRSPTNPYPHYPNHHYSQQISPTNNGGYNPTTASSSASSSRTSIRERNPCVTLFFNLAYASRGFLPATTAPNSIPEIQPISYPQTSPLAGHRPTRPTAVVPPLPKDPVISSPMGSMSTAPSMIPSTSNYQQISPQKSSNNYSKQVNKFERSIEMNISSHVFSPNKKFKSHMNQTVRRKRKNDETFLTVSISPCSLLSRPILYNHYMNMQIIQTNQ